MKKKQTITLFYQKGKILKDENGNIATPHGIVKLTYGSLAWKNYLKSALNIGITGMKVESVYDSPIGGGKGDYIDIDESIIEEVAAVFKPKLSDLTPEQIQIQELKDQVKALTEAFKAKPSESIKAEDNSGDDLEELRAEFEKAVGKKPHHKTSREKLISEINKHK